MYYVSLDLIITENEICTHLTIQLYNCLSYLHLHLHQQAVSAKVSRNTTSTFLQGSHFCVQY